MPTVGVDQSFAATLRDAEAHWYDTNGWPRWIDGLERVVEVDRRWPAAGAVIRWESGPAGRGQVTERVVSYEPGAGQTVEVRDVSIDGRQSVGFTAIAGGVRVELELEYRIRRRSPLTPLIDRLFIRRPMIASLQRTLDRFGARLDTPANT